MWSCNMSSSDDVAVCPCGGKTEFTALKHRIEYHSASVGSLIELAASMQAAIRMSRIVFAAVVADCCLSLTASWARAEPETARDAQRTIVRYIGRITFCILTSNKWLIYHYSTRDIEVRHPNLKPSSARPACFLGWTTIGRDLHRRCYPSLRETTCRQMLTPQFDQFPTLALLILQQSGIGCPDCGCRFRQTRCSEVAVNPAVKGWRQDATQASGHTR